MPTLPGIDRKAPQPLGSAPSAKVGAWATTDSLRRGTLSTRSAGTRSPARGTDSTSSSRRTIAGSGMGAVRPKSAGPPSRLTMSYSMGDKMIDEVDPATEGGTGLGSGRRPSADGGVSVTPKSNDAGRGLLQRSRIGTTGLPSTRSASARSPARGADSTSSARKTIAGSGMGRGSVDSDEEDAGGGLLQKSRIGTNGLPSTRSVGTRSPARGADSTSSARKTIAGSGMGRGSVDSDSDDDDAGRGLLQRSRIGTTGLPSTTRSASARSPPARGADSTSSARRTIAVSGMGRGAVRPKSAGNASRLTMSYSMGDKMIDEVDPSPWNEVDPSLVRARSMPDFGNKTPSAAVFGIREVEDHRAGDLRDQRIDSKESMPLSRQASKKSIGSVSMSSLVSIESSAYNDDVRSLTNNSRQASKKSIGSIGMSSFMSIASSAYNDDLRSLTNFLQTSNVDQSNNNRLNFLQASNPDFVTLSYAEATAGLTDQSFEGIRQRLAAERVRDDAKEENEMVFIPPEEVLDVAVALLLERHPALKEDIKRYGAGQYAIRAAMPGGASNRSRSPSKNVNFGTKESSPSESRRASKSPSDSRRASKESNSDSLLEQSSSIQPAVFQRRATMPSSLGARRSSSSQASSHDGSSLGELPDDVSFRSLSKGINSRSSSKLKSSRQSSKSAMVRNEQPLLKAQGGYQPLGELLEVCVREYLLKEELQSKTKYCLAAEKAWTTRQNYLRRATFTKCFASWKSLYSRAQAGESTGLRRCLLWSFQLWACSARGEKASMQNQKLGEICWRYGQGQCVPFRTWQQVVFRSWLVVLDESRKIKCLESAARECRDACNRLRQWRVQAVSCMEQIQARERLASASAYWALWRSQIELSKRIQADSMIWSEAACMKQEVVNASEGARMMQIFSSMNQIPEGRLAFLSRAVGEVSHQLEMKKRFPLIKGTQKWCIEEGRQSRRAEVEMNQRLIDSQEPLSEETIATMDLRLKVERQQREVQEEALSAVCALAETRRVADILQDEIDFVLGLRCFSAWVHRVRRDFVANRERKFLDRANARDERQAAYALCLVDHWEKARLNEISNAAFSLWSNFCAELRAIQRGYRHGNSTAVAQEREQHEAKVAALKERSNTALRRYGRHVLGWRKALNLHPLFCCWASEAAQAKLCQQREAVEVKLIEDRQGFEAEVSHFRCNSRAAAHRQCLHRAAFWEQWSSTFIFSVWLQDWRDRRWEQGKQKMGIQLQRVISCGAKSINFASLWRLLQRAWLVWSHLISLSRSSNALHVLGRSFVTRMASYQWRRSCSKCLSDAFTAWISLHMQAGRFQQLQRMKGYHLSLARRAAESVGEMHLRSCVTLFCGLRCFGLWALVVLQEQRAHFTERLGSEEKRLRVRFGDSKERIRSWQRRAAGRFGVVVALYIVRLAFISWLLMAKDLYRLRSVAFHFMQQKQSERHHLAMASRLQQWREQAVEDVPKKWEITELVLCFKAWFLLTWSLLRSRSLARIRNFDAVKFHCAQILSGWRVQATYRYHVARARYVSRRSGRAAMMAWWRLAVSGRHREGKTRLACVVRDVAHRVSRNVLRKLAQHAKTREKQIALQKHNMTKLDIGAVEEKLAEQIHLTQLHKDAHDDARSQIAAMMRDHAADSLGVIKVQTSSRVQMALGCWRAWRAWSQLCSEIRAGFVNLAFFAWRICTFEKSTVSEQKESLSANPAAANVLSAWSGKPPEQLLAEVFELWSSFMFQEKRERRVSQLQAMVTRKRQQYDEAAQILLVPAISRSRSYLALDHCWALWIKAWYARRLERERSKNSEYLQNHFLAIHFRLFEWWDTMRINVWCCRCFFAWGLWMNTKVSILLANSTSQKDAKGRWLVGGLFEVWLKSQEALKMSICWSHWYLAVKFQQTEHWQYVASALQYRFADVRKKAISVYDSACAAAWAVLCFRFWSQKRIMDSVKARELVEMSEVHGRVVVESTGSEAQAQQSIQALQIYCRNIQKRRSGILGSMAELLTSLQISLLEAACFRAWKDLCWRIVTLRRRDVAGHM